MRAEIISVGTELLLGQIVDTNAAELGALFAEVGLSHYHRQTVGDHQDRLVAALRLALSRSEVVVTIGGLGPTEDDMTRTAISEAIGQPLVPDPAIEDHLRDIFARRGIKWTDSQVRQAERPSDSFVLSNPNGTAPGLICPFGDKVVIALPGPRNEFVPMARGPLREYLRSRDGGEPIVSTLLKIVGLGESQVEKQLLDLMHSTDPTLAPYAKVGEVHLRITTQGAGKAAEDKLNRVAEVIRERLGTAVYGSGEETLESVIVAMMRDRNLTLAVAESCTGGGLGGRMTAVDGSSEVFQGGFITYQNEVKTRLLGVPPAVFDTQGAVSDECARAMAAGAKDRLGVSHALSVTGVAGEQSVSENGIEKPSGLVFIGLATPTRVISVRHQFAGNRETIRARAIQNALAILRQDLLGDK